MKIISFKKLLLSSLLCVVCFSLYGQQKNPRLIVRADDMGAFRSANIACLETAKKGIATSIEVMVVTAWFPEAVKMLCENPGIDVGLHLTLTSEWDNVKWRPLTNCPSLTDENGYFLPMMNPSKDYPGLAITERKWNIKEVEQEARAQIEMALKNIPHISHISGHMGSTGFDPQVEELMARLFEEYHLPVIDRKGSMKKYSYQYIGYAGPSKTFAEKEVAFIKMLDKMESGKNYMFVDHPALDNEEMQTVGHIGYENVAEDRQGVTDLFLSQKVIQALKDKKIELISYGKLTDELHSGGSSSK